MPVAAPARRRAPRSPKARDQATAYARAVVAGRIVVNGYVRAACQRHLDDLAHGPARGLRWDPVVAEGAIAFFGFLRLAEGDFEGLPFVLQPWQAFIVGSLFGWLTADGSRRFRNAYIETAKGNGKTPLAAGIGLYGLVADDEAAPEIYCAAAGRDQAGILFTDAKRMVARSPALAQRLEVLANAIAYPAVDGTFRPVSSEAGNLHGHRPHIVLIDELHAHPNSDVVDAMRAGTKGRRQALIVRITNAGYDRTSACWQDHAYSTAILEGTIANDSWFGFVCGLDPEDDWTDEAVWPKANPNLGVSISHRYLREQVAEALGMPARQSVVQRLNFCVWTSASAGAIDLERWDACAEPPAIPDGATVYGGLDLSSTTDLAALVLAYQDAGGVVHLLTRFWCPEATVEARTQRDHLPYDVWVREGAITATPGDVTDYEAILADLTALSERYQIAELAFVRLNATQFVQSAGALTTMVPIAQTFVGLSAASKDLLSRVTAQTLSHGGQPVLRWMASHLVVDENAAGDLKPSNERSSERISGLTAAVLAIARLTAPHEPPPAEPGILTFMKMRAAEARALAGLTDPPTEHGTSTATGHGAGETRCGFLYRAPGPSIGTCGLPIGHAGEHGAE